MEKVRIFDTTLRDGEQSPGFSMNIHEKVRMARQLEKLGDDIIEAGFPVASQGDFEAVSLIAQAVQHAQVAGLARANDKDIDRAWEAIRIARNPRIHTFISTSDIHLTHQLRKSRDEVLSMATAAVKRAKSYTEDVEFSAMDATRSDRDYLCRVIEAAIDAGATTVNIPALREFRETFPYFKGPFKDMGYQVQRYLPGEFYQGHIDGGSHEFSQRQLVVLWYLNDVAEGGETEFTELDVRCHPHTGRLLIFPPFWMYRHAGRPPRSNSKYILSTYTLW